MRRFGFLCFYHRSAVFSTDILTEIPGRATFRFLCVYQRSAAFSTEILNDIPGPRFPAEIPGRQLRASAIRARRGGERQRYAVRFSSERWRRRWAGMQTRTEARTWTRYGGREDTAGTPA